MKQAEGMDIFFLSSGEKKREREKFTDFSLIFRVFVLDDRFHGIWSSYAGKAFFPPSSLTVINNSISLSGS